MDGLPVAKRPAAKRNRDLSRDESAVVKPGWNREKVEVFRDSFYEFLNHVSISSKEKGQMVLGQSLYRAQTMFYEAVFDGLADDVHDFYILKSRQLGISTGTRALSLFWVGMHEGLRGAMVFDTAFNTNAARREIEETLDNLPKSMHFPKIKSRNRDVLILENNSWIMFMQAGTKNSRSGGGLGRSLGLNFIHASETSSWANEEGVTSFRQSLSQDWANRLYIWESTARGYELWYRLWSEAEADPLRKRTLFIGWWAKDNQQWPRNSAEFSVYGLDPPTQRELERIQAVKELYDWEITPEQLAWYRWKSDPTRELDEDDPEDSTIVQEQPWTAGDAFQMTGSSFFMGDKLALAAARLATIPQPRLFRFWPNMNFVTCDIQPSRNKREIEFRMWEEPVQDSWYVVAADPAFGHDEHNANSAAQVLRCYADGIEQIGEYASATIQPHHFAWLLWTLIGYYGATKANCRVGFICELNGPGEEVWRQFRQTEQIVRNGYLALPAREKGISSIFQNCSSYIYSRSDSMNAGNNWQWKCLAIDTRLPTPSGWTTIRDVSEGDLLFDEFGESCQVIGVSEVKHGHFCYRITFDDTSIVCDQDHKWKTSDGIIRTTKELRAGLHTIWSASPLNLGQASPGKRRPNVGKTHKIVFIEPVNSVPVKCVAVNSPSHLFLAGDAMIPTHNTNQQIKVQIMEACRNYMHNGTLIVNSYDVIEEMRTISRDGDEIRAEGDNRDDRTFALALGIRYWEDRFRRPLIAGNRTREAERAKVSMSIQDQYALWRRNLLEDFFKVKQANRVNNLLEARRMGWRQGIGVRRPPPQRRW